MVATLTLIVKKHCSRADDTPNTNWL